MCKYKTYKTASWLSSQYQANQCCQNDTNNKKQDCYSIILRHKSAGEPVPSQPVLITWTGNLPSSLLTSPHPCHRGWKWKLQGKLLERHFYIFLSLFQEVSSQLISTTSVLSVLVGGIYNGKWLPVRPILWNHLHHFKKATAPLSGLRGPISCCSFTPWQVKNACK